MLINPTIKILFRRVSCSATRRNGRAQVIKLRPVLLKPDSRVRASRE